VPAKKCSKKPDNSPYVHARRKSQIEINIHEKIPWTEKQKEFIRLAQNKTVKFIFLQGYAGTSKTLISVYCALKALQEKKISDIIYVRSIVESASNKLGYLPGDLDDKISPYLRPLTDKLDELLIKEHRASLESNKLIEGIPVNHLRGAHFAGKYILIDEAQNFSLSELTTVMTRIGEYSKVIMCGDVMQSDIAGAAFERVCGAFDNEEANENGIHVFRFEKEDIVRSELVKYTVSILETLK
jgi:phosphate starvation-inducible PhoH-like protein